MDAIRRLGVLARDVMDVAAVLERDRVADDEFRAGVRGCVDRERDGRLVERHVEREEHHLPNLPRHRAHGRGRRPVADAPGHFSEASSFSVVGS